MIRFLVTGAHRYTLEDIRTARAEPRIDIAHYEDLARIKRLLRATYIFADLDRLGAGEIEEASRLYRLLAHAGVPVLNDPARVKTRLPLLRALHRAGLNDFEAHRAAEIPSTVRFPVFVRRVVGHGKPLSDLLHNWQELDDSLQTAVRGGLSIDQLMVIEYAGEPVRDGKFRKLAAFKIGSSIVPHFCVNDVQWLVKTGFSDLDIEDLYEEERQILETNPYAEHLTKVFEVAGIDYGRADFGFFKGRLQVFEINLNPAIPPPCDHASATRVGNMKIAWEKYLDGLAKIDSPSNASVCLRDVVFPPQLFSVLDRDPQRRARRKTWRQYQQAIKWRGLRVLHHLQNKVFRDAPFPLAATSYATELRLNRPRVRYARPATGEVKVHPFKKLAASISKCCPRSWRFFLFGLPSRARSSELSLVESSSQVARLSRGLACQNGAHLNPNGTYVPHLTLGAGSFIESRFLKQQRCLPRIRKVTGTVLSLVSDGDLNYYRWLMETLPRFRYVREIAPQCDWIYCRQSAPFHRATLELLGCDPVRFLSSDNHRFLQGSSVLVPPFINEAEEWILPWLRDQFLPLAKARTSALGKRIYLSRAKATGRRVVQESELISKLVPLGFSVVRLEDHDWLDQVALMRTAEIVVAPHGAGLANTVFCEPGTSIIEFIAPHYPYTFFPRISQQLGLDHHMVECVPTDPGHVHSSDLMVDFESLKARLRAVGIKK